MAYDNKHKALLQQIIEKGVILNEEVQRLTIKLFNNDDVLLFATALNSKLQPLNMEIKSMTCELSGDKYWMLSSTVQTDMAKFQTEFSPGELQLLRKIFTVIIESDTGSVSSTNCLNLCSSLESELSISNAQDFLTMMVELKYLFFKDGIFFMGVRSISELMPYFRASYEQGSFHTCFLCKQVIFHGHKCDHCDVTLHLYCLVNFGRLHNLMKCPNCKQPMSIDNSSDVNLDQDIVEESFTTLSTQESTSRKRSTRKRPHTSR